MLLIVSETELKVAENHDNGEKDACEGKQQHYVYERIEATAATRIEELKPPEDGCGQDDDAEYEVGDAVFEIELRTENGKCEQRNVVDVAANEEADEKPRECQPGEVAVCGGD